ncbi:peptidase domain-containing ABC transporter [Cyanobium sp. LEGE 06113]|uniref:peptidase domain-containing ABC transporter n=1 Tax=Cyanobium sp. LEGE 06113 TaxID=1297573 RepID=UPI0018800F35|nr:peptidase domain-containing ABC transporter [Cyanobium sp. LEGE 06113]MBE9154460.1 peptidase domain-containing ABC transporter [Cyanobium sp. LEGE 06113]
MTASHTTALLQHPAFSGLSDKTRQQLEEQITYLRFRIGQPLSAADLLSDRVLLIVSGHARLLLAHGGRMLTLTRLGPGDLVGLASLLRASPCEQVHAIDELVAACLPDRLVMELLGGEPSFRRWCQHTLFPSELGALLPRYCEPDQDTVAGQLEQLVQVARPLPPEAAALAGLQPGEEVLVGSANVPGLAIGDVVSPATPPRSSGPLPVRLLALRPGDLPARPGQQEAAAVLPAGNAIKPAETALRRTSLDLGQEDLARGLQLVRANGTVPETVACFQMLGQLMNLPFRRDSLEKVLHDSLGRGQKPNLQLCGQRASNLGLHVVATRVPARLTGQLQVPALVPWQSSFALITASDSQGITVASPAQGWVKLSAAQVEEQFPEGIELLVVERGAETKQANFDVSWFLPAIKRHRAALVQVLIASFVVQLFTLANPLLIMVIIDKVISQRSLDTLQVLGIGLLVVTLLEGVLKGLRTFLFKETTNRIDMRLGAEVIDHLLRLPLNYFDRRPVGELSSRVAELETIRNFLTGQALTSFLDAVFAVIYIVVMVMFSWLLTLIALAVLPIQIGITVAGAPLFRRQFRRAAEENARTQAHLVEVLNGIQTVKAQNVEMVSRWKWQDFYAAYVERSFEKSVTGTTLTETSQVLQKISQLLVLWVGASLVLDGQLSLGGLIAFRIISGYVTQPLLRLSTLWQSIQELKVSFERLADVVETPQESTPVDQSKPPLPPIRGAVHFERVSFCFQPGMPFVLRDTELSIPEGTFVGVAGQSGSGKSTLMKLLSRLYAPTEGRILIDGIDIAKVELYSLRRQIGIVPQEPLLLSGTVAENIAITDPNASYEAIVAAAQAACAHEFVMELADGYSTQVGERGASLSGGQRQRIAIARTLLSRPKLLVLDEATSALDYDTESQVCQRLRASLKGCTVFFITHRLNTIRNADRIVLLDRGTIAESGTHASLIAQQGRYYSLYRQQEAGA